MNNKPAIVVPGIGTYQNMKMAGGSNLRIQQFPHKINARFHFIIIQSIKIPHEDSFLGLSETAPLNRMKQTEFPRFQKHHLPPPKHPNLQDVSWHG